MGRGDAGLEYGTLEVAGVRRGYWLARGPSGPGPLLVVLHGSGTSGFAEHVARHGLLPVAGLFVVVGTIKSSAGRPSRCRGSTRR